VVKKADLSHFQLVALISHYNEDLSWLKTLNFRNPVPFIIVSKSWNRPETLYLEYNMGNEVSSYLIYIIKYYDKLPLYTLFLHGHDTHWHQFCNIRFNIDNFNFQDKYKNINNIGLSNSWREGKMNGLRNIWQELFEFELGPMPEVFQEKCCSQFFLHRDRIRLRPRIFYERILEYVLTKDVLGEDGYHYEMSYYMEYIWHYIFGEDAIIDASSYDNNDSVMIYDKYEIVMEANHENGKIYYYF